METKYNFYSTLLDAYQSFLDCSQTYQKYWGNSDNPKLSEEEYEAEQFKGLISRINREPFSSEAADRGTAFNELIDCRIEGRGSEIMDITTCKEKFKVHYNDHNFSFPRKKVNAFAKMYTGALTQVRTEALLSTKYGDVLLYGYIDELLPQSVHDIKTTTHYSFGKFRKHWQKVVYPYCLQQEGNRVSAFLYDVVVFDKELDFDIYQEFYDFVPQRDIPHLREHVESLIEFVECNRSLITDEKIFNYITQP